MPSSYSRKSFFGKIAGLIAAVGIAPALFGRSASSGTPADASPAPSSTSFKLRPDTRAVARREDTV